MEIVELSIEWSKSEKFGITIPHILNEHERRTLDIRPGDEVEFRLKWDRQRKVYHAVGLNKERLRTQREHQRRLRVERKRARERIQREIEKKLKSILKFGTLTSGRFTRGLF